MKSLLKRNLQGRKIVLLFTITTVFYLVMITVTIPKVASYANGMQLLDMLPFGYDHYYVNELFSALGNAGREAYLKTQIPLDMIYPGLFAITYSMIFAYLLKGINKLDTRYFYLSYLPIVAGLFDYFENIGIIIILQSFPNNGILLSNLTAMFSVVKGVSTTVYFIALLILIALFAFTKMGERKNVIRP